MQRKTTMGVYKEVSSESLSTIHVALIADWHS